MRQATCLALLLWLYHLAAVVVETHTTHAPQRASVIVDVQLPGSLPQQQNGAFEAMPGSKNGFIRRINRAGVYFTLQQDSAAEYWLLDGFLCKRDTIDSTADTCKHFVTSTLMEPARSEAHNGESAVFDAPLMFREIAHVGRQLQLFGDSETTDPWVFEDDTPAYYDCGYSGVDQWCCAESNANGNGPSCFDISPGKCEETPMWGGQSQMCCNPSDPNDCTITFKQPLPTQPPTPTPTPFARNYKNARVRTGECGQACVEQRD